MAISDQPVLATSTIPPRNLEAEPAHWKLATRIAFRLCFIYFGLYVLFTQMLPSLLPLPFVSGLGGALNKGRDHLGCNSHFSDLAFHHYV